MEDESNLVASTTSSTPPPPPRGDETPGKIGGTDPETPNRSVDSDIDIDNPQPQQHSSVKPGIKRPKRDLFSSPLKKKIISPQGPVSDECRKLKESIEIKEEKLRKLQLVEYYRNKWSKDELKGVIGEWKDVALESFEELYTKEKQHNPNLTKEEMLQYLGVEPKLLN